ncbi:MAG: hypothetical protein AMS18_07215 [Gemmatimonas sp. SG8_17]|nr:MAG: hypothetical protein AMS18_07215 [Gemmatimonas sp. SG8_17]
MLSRSGFTVTELIIAIVIVGLVSAFAIPKVKSGMAAERLRSARRSVTTHLATTRGTASGRGCRSVMHIRGGANARLWVTSCTVGGGGVDTIGSVENLSDRYGVTLTTTGDSVIFNSNGLGRSPGWITLNFSKSGRSDTLGISPVGLPAW